MTSDCVVRFGLSIYADENSLILLNQRGNSETVPVNQIDAIFIYNLVENPIGVIKLDTPSKAHLLEIFTDDTSKPQVVGWPVRFVEDLLIFYSLSGKTHVYRFDDISRIRPARLNLPQEIRVRNFRAAVFHVPAVSDKCPVRTPTGDNQVKPTRAVADRIGVSVYMDSLQRGFEALESFKERTYLYAKPYLFEKNPRLGIQLGSKYEEFQNFRFPFYYQWSTGKPFRFQSFNLIGTQRQEIVPNLDPVNAIRTDVKSHLFHGAFIGNIIGVAAGDPVFLQEGRSWAKSELPAVHTSFNYLALMGADYGPYSFSGGFYFPSFYFKVGDHQRELLGGSVKYAWRIMYTRAGYRLRVLASLVNLAVDKPGEEGIRARLGEVKANPPDEFSLESLFIRAGLDLEVTEELAFSFDWSSTGGKYFERTGPERSSIDFSRNGLAISAKFSFGDYVALSATGRQQFSLMSGALASTKADLNESQTYFFGSLEFIF